MKKPGTLLLGLAICLPCIFGCTSVMVTTYKLDEAEGYDGVVYYLPKKLIKLKIEVKEDALIATLTALPSVPDTDVPYIAHLNHKASRSDDLTIQTTKEGLLKAVKSISEEQTAQIIVKLSEAVVEAAKLVATVSTRFPAADPLEGKEPPRTFETVFDPSDAKAESDINEQLALTAFKEYQIKVDRPVAPEGKLAFPVDGIVHRRAGVVTIHLLKTVESERKPAVSVLGEQFVIPNVGPVTVIPMEAGPFVKTEYDLKFEDGLLTEMHATKPSELLAIVQIIPDTLKSIASIPAELVQVKVDYSTKAKSLLDARKNIIDAQKGLLEKQGELIDAQKALLEKQREGETSDDNDARNDPNE